MNNPFLSPSAGRLWFLLGLITFLIFILVWIPTNCIYNPEQMGIFECICGRSNKSIDYTPKETHKSKRSVHTLENSPPVAITHREDATYFWYNSSKTHVATYRFNHSLCKPAIVPRSATIYICVTDNYWGRDCGYWGAVGWNTGQDWGYRPQSALDRKDRNGKSLISRMTLLKPDFAPAPVGVDCKHCHNAIPLTLNIENPGPQDQGTYLLGVHFPGGGTIHHCKIELKDMYQSKEWEDLSLPPPNLLKLRIQSFQDMVAIADPTYEDTMAAETGFSDVNFWLEWMRYNVQQHNKSNCYVCGKARPHLGTVPLNIPPEQENCFFSLFTNTNTNDTQCEKWKQEYPILTKNPNPGNTITIYPGNYTCYVSNSPKGRDLKVFPEGYCAERRSTSITGQTQSLGDIYWICGNLKLRTKLDTAWKGECALAKIIMPLHIISEGKEVEAISENKRRKIQV